ncbi:C1 family peptidase [Bdellovibrio bacteriovorus]|uniref:Peptidase C1A papain C-terminal domain-containing protein n=1 Tax=Bdellovibrio bacteriovorus str. Tiberius TaxID=1069642 RepID=K7YVS5_BDEBC|nr:C1 family peptidase [Bdellovibrio bacteriovorus]AFY00795.1 hypothetical protein Bdt_1095 [Bdellovibrio bacteriovorus str. Tiberius]
MIQFISFLLGTLLFCATLWAQPDCKNAVRDISTTADHIKTVFKTTDVAREVEYIQETVRTCNVNIAKFGWGRGIFDYWKTTGYNGQLTTLQNKIEHESMYKDVEAELNEYKKYATILGLDPSKTNSYYDTYRQQGRQSRDREENTCQAVDLRNDTLGPVRDQDGIGWCYAFAAADLLTYRLGKKVSAVDLALNYNDKWDNNLLKQVGWAEHEFEGAASRNSQEVTIEKTAQKGGACLEENLRSEDNGPASLMENLIQLDKLKRDTAELTPIRCPSAQKIFPTINTKELMDIAKESSRASFIASLSNKACEPRISLKGIEVERKGSHLLGDALKNDKSEMFAALDEQLNRKNIVAISYYASILYNANAPVTGGHASSIVGRKYNRKSGECEYLIRNSWGRGCNSYDTRYKCEEGNIWIPKSIVSKGLRNVSYIK